MGEGLYSKVTCTGAGCYVLADPSPTNFCRSMALFEFVGISNVVDYPNSPWYIMEKSKHSTVIARSQLSGKSQRITRHLHNYFTR